MVDEKQNRPSNSSSESSDGPDSSDSEDDGDKTQSPIGPKAKAKQQTGSPRNPPVTYSAESTSKNTPPNITTSQPRPIPQSASAAIPPIPSAPGSTKEAPGKASKTPESALSAQTRQPSVPVQGASASSSQDSRRQSASTPKGEKRRPESPRVDKKDDSIELHWSMLRHSMNPSSAVPTDASTPSRRTSLPPTQKKPLPLASAATQNPPSRPQTLPGVSTASKGSGTPATAPAARKLETSSQKSLPLSGKSEGQRPRTPTISSAAQKTFHPNPNDEQTSSSDETSSEDALSEEIVPRRTTEEKGKGKGTGLEQSKPETVKRTARAAQVPPSQGVQHDKPTASREAHLANIPEEPIRSPSSKLQPNISTIPGAMVLLPKSPKESPVAKQSSSTPDQPAVSSPANPGPRESQTSRAEMKPQGQSLIVKPSEPSKAPRSKNKGRRSSDISSSSSSGSDSTEKPEKIASGNLRSPVKDDQKKAEESDSLVPRESPTQAMRARQIEIERQKHARQREQEQRYSKKGKGNEPLEEAYLPQTTYAPPASGAASSKPAKSLETPRTTASFQQQLIAEPLTASEQAVLNKNPPMDPVLPSISPSQAAALKKAGFDDPFLQLATSLLALSMDNVSNELTDEWAVATLIAENKPYLYDSSKPSDAVIKFEEHVKRPSEVDFTPKCINLANDAISHVKRRCSQIHLQYTALKWLLFAEKIKRKEEAAVWKASLDDRSQKEPVYSEEESLLQKRVKFLEKENEEIRHLFSNADAAETKAETKLLQKIDEMKSSRQEHWDDAQPRLRSYLEKILAHAGLEEEQARIMDMLDRQSQVGKLEDEIDALHERLDLERQINQKLGASHGNIVSTPVKLVTDLQIEQFAHQELEKALADQSTELEKAKSKINELDDKLKTSNNEYDILKDLSLVTEKQLNENIEKQVKEQEIAEGRWKNAENQLKMVNDLFRSMRDEFGGSNMEDDATTELPGVRMLETQFRELFQEHDLNRDKVREHLNDALRHADSSWQAISSELNKEKHRNMELREMVDKLANVQGLISREGEPTTEEGELQERVKSMVEAELSRVDRMPEIQQELDDLKKVNMALESELRALNEIKERNMDLKDEVEELKKLMEINAGLKYDVEELNKLKETNAGLHGEVKELDNLKKTNSILQDKLKELEDRMKSNVTLQDKVQELDELKKTIAKLTDEMEKANQLKRTADANLEDEAQALEKLKQTNISLQEQVRELDELKKANAKLEEKVQELAGVVENKETLLGDKEKLLDYKEKLLGDKETDISGMKETCGGLEKEIQDKDDVISKSEKKLEDYKNVIHRKEAAILDWERKFAALEGNVRQREAAIADFKENYDTLLINNQMLRDEVADKQKAEEIASKHQSNKRHSYFNQLKSMIGGNIAEEEAPPTEGERTSIPADPPTPVRSAPLPVAPLSIRGRPSFEEHAAWTGSDLELERLLFSTRLVRVEQCLMSTFSARATDDASPGDLAPAADHAQHARDHAARLAEPHLQALAAYWEAQVLYYDNQVEAAGDCFAEAARLFALAADTAGPAADPDSDQDLDDRELFLDDWIACCEVAEPLNLNARAYEKMLIGES